MRKVYVVTFDGTYGAGVETVFSDKVKAENFAKAKNAERSSWVSYTVEEFIVDEEELTS